MLLSIEYIQGKNTFDLTRKWSDPQFAPVKAYTSYIYGTLLF
jgi:hypothetical protein